METLVNDDFNSMPTARPHRTDRFAYEKFTEQSAPDMVMSSRRVHAEGYYSMGFVHNDAVTNEGTLSDDIDKAQGDLVEYYAGIDLENEDSSNEGVVVTLRKVSIPEGGTIEDLPAYKLCESVIGEEEKRALLAIPGPDDRIREIGALARVEGSNPLATLELLRNVHQESLGKGEIWFFGIVKETYQALEDNFGKQAIRRIGNPVGFDDARIGENVALVPAIVDVDNLLDNMVIEMQNEQNGSHRNRIFRTLLFFSDGLKDDEMSDDVKSLRDGYLETLQRKRA